MGRRWRRPASWPARFAIRRAETARRASSTLIPVDARDWDAHMPLDAPAIAKTLLIAPQKRAHNSDREPRPRGLRLSLKTMALIETVDLWKTYVMGDEEIHALRGVSISDRARRVRRDHGAVGLGQVDADEPDRLPRYAEQGLVPAERQAGQPDERQRAGADPQRGDRLRLPDVQSAAARDGAAQRGAAAGLRGRRREGSRGACEGARSRRWSSRSA